MILCQLVTMSLVSFFCARDESLSGYLRYTQFCHFSCSHRRVADTLGSWWLNKLCPFQFDSHSIVKHETVQHCCETPRFLVRAATVAVLSRGGTDSKITWRWGKKRGSVALSTDDEMMMMMIFFGQRGRRIICVRSENNEITLFFLFSSGGVCLAIDESFTLNKYTYTCCVWGEEGKAN